ncbi:50S ribosomal protein L25 [Cohnella caldifontis]|uniref:50S ribosomal protein L25 n=1 Tax=Cohnella caldifontis TaxID=3027471 RepID=UPI0023EAF226|nr:50S ribosomal protein L25 [Cohnella sp. YIM B05605]
MNLTLKAEKRETGSGSALRRLRRGGLVPGVVYGKGLPEPTPVSIPLKDLQAVLRANPHAVIELEIPGLGREHVLISEMQTEPLSRDVMHVDFHQINMNEKIRAPIRLELSGKSVGEKEGGLLQLVHHELEVECLAKDLPDFVSLDVSNLQMGDSLTVADLTLPAGVRPILDEDEVLVTVLAPQKDLTEAEAEAADDKAEERENQAKAAPMVD